MVNERWFVNSRFDLTLFHVPVWLCWLTAFLLPASVRGMALPVWVWVGAVLLVDVGHVWSSIYRTYLDPTTRKNQPGVLRCVPICCFAVCLALALHSDALFWRVLAYVAVFHFIKQQYGITALYAYRQVQGRGDRHKIMAVLRRWDKAAVYVGTCFPVLVWHLTPGKNISWFIPGDFLPLGEWITPSLTQGGFGFLWPVLKYSFAAVWVGTPLIWLFIHWRTARRFGMAFPLGKSLWVLGTCINWYLGIVYFDSDLIFTLTNVIAHGVPYYGLIGLYGARKLKGEGYGARVLGMRAVNAVRLLPMSAFLAVVLGLAYLEEHFWNTLVYDDHTAFFHALVAYPGTVPSSPFWRGFWIALLSMPQVIHYVLDGFIWKFDKRNPDLKDYLFGVGAVRT